MLRGRDTWFYACSVSLPAIRARPGASSTREVAWAPAALWHVQLIAKRSFRDGINRSGVLWTQHTITLHPELRNRTSCIAPKIAAKEGAEEKLFSARSNSVQLLADFKCKGCEKILQFLELRFDFRCLFLGEWLPIRNVIQHNLLKIKSTFSKLI